MFEMKVVYVNGKVKRLVLGTLPAVCGVVVPAFGEKIFWPESLVPRELFQAPAPPASMPSAEEAHAERLRREVRHAEVDGLFGRPWLFKEEPATAYGIRF